MAVDSERGRSCDPYARFRANSALLDSGCRLPGVHCFELRKEGDSARGWAWELGPELETRDAGLRDAGPQDAVPRDAVFPCRVSVLGDLDASPEAASGAARGDSSGPAGGKVCFSPADVTRVLNGTAAAGTMPPGGSNVCVLTEYIVPQSKVLLFKRAEGGGAKAAVSGGGGASPEAAAAADAGGRGEAPLEAAAGPSVNGGGGASPEAAGFDVFELHCLGARVDMALPPDEGLRGFFGRAAAALGPGAYTFTRDYTAGEWYLTDFGEDYPLGASVSLGTCGSLDALWGAAEAEAGVGGFCVLRAHLPGRAGAGAAGTGEAGEAGEGAARITGISDGLERVVYLVREGDSAESDGQCLAVAWSQSPQNKDAQKELSRTLEQLYFDGIGTNRELLAAYLRGMDDEGRINRGANRFWGLTNALRGDIELIEILEPGIQSTLQAGPGRLGCWMVGIPPSGPMDGLHARAANDLLGNRDEAAVIEITATAFSFRALGSAVFASAGMDCRVRVNSQEIRESVFTVRRGDKVVIRPEGSGGCRRYLAVRGGFRVKAYLGSASCFAMGGMGGWGGRILKKGDRLSWNAAPDARPGSRSECFPLKSPHIARGEPWVLRIFWGPQADAAYFCPDFLKTLTDAVWKVDHNSDRSGIRLIGPKPRWARSDGGEAGLHPSNIHDNAYAVGSIDFTGDMPIILGPDGPSLGGFLCPAVTADADLWKLGQLRPGDELRFKAEELDYDLPEILLTGNAAARRAGILLEGVSADDIPWMIRAAGDSNLLVEVGPEELDIALRFMVQHLFDFIGGEKIPGIVDLTPGIRSLQIHFDPAITRAAWLVERVRDYLGAYRARDEAVLPKRSIFLPLSWDDSSTRRAVEIYTRSVNPNAPWCPSNIEFIRRINGLESIEDVRDIVFSAHYLVLGLGDVYKGAPVAVPIDPRRRLVTTKYNPARTWTPENAVGIGGSYLCIYGMEGPGGYQFVGRTLQVWNSFQKTQEFEKPWLLRFFDTIRFFPVDEGELADIREAFPKGGYSPRIEHDSFNLAEYRAFLEMNEDSIKRFKSRQSAAYADERRAWAAMEG